MADAERPTTELEQSLRVAKPAAAVVDFGVAPLELPVRPADETLITEFVDDAAPPSAADQPPGPDSSRLPPSLSPGLPPTAGEIQESSRATPSRARGLVPRIALATARFIVWLIRSLFGIASLILLLAVVAAIPIVNFLALGYLLEVEGRLARSGKLREAFPLIDLAPRLGSIALGIWAWVFPLRLLSHAAADARLIDPGSRADIGLHLLLNVLAVVVTAHLCLALSRGGSLFSFMWPLLVPVAVLLSPVLVPVLGAVALIRRDATWLAKPLRRELAAFRSIATSEYWNHASGAVRDFIAGLRLKHHFLLGFKGYIGAMIWLVVPTALFAAATKTEGGPILVTLLGGVLLIIVLSWMPFLQVHFAAENRFGAMFELRTVRRLYKNAPFAWMITMLITLTLALPMYLFKIALPPSDAMWMVTIVFIVSIYPVKVITGWAYHRAVTREKRAWFGLRWLTRLVLLPLLTLYVFLLFFTQFIGEHGKRVLFEHHAFLLPAPF
jgi:hypothetical protein